MAFKTLSHLIDVISYEFMENYSWKFDDKDKVAIERDRVDFCKRTLENITILSSKNKEYSQKNLKFTGQEIIKGDFFVYIMAGLSCKPYLIEFNRYDELVRFIKEDNIGFSTHIICQIPLPFCKVDYLGTDNLLA